MGAPTDCPYCATPGYRPDDPCCPSAEVHQLRAALTRILDAFYSRNGFNNTHLLDALEDADRLV